jgi:hypothetical protein
MEIDQAGEWQRLTEHYRAMYDEELLKLAAEFGDLTEMAKQVLRDELRIRGLGDPTAPKPAPSIFNRPAAFHDEPPIPERALEPAVDDLGEDLPHEYTWKTFLCECETREQAIQLAEALRRAGVESWIDTMRSSDGYRRILVPADQIEQARAIAAQPIPPDIVEASTVEVPEFEATACPRCGAEDPTLESAAVGNCWLCESCGHRWIDAEEDPEEQTASE